jgi:iron(III) transport system ATP-binding protein
MKMTNNMINTQSMDKWESADLVLKNIVKQFDDGSGQKVTAVNDLSLTIKKGEFVTLLGPSGCGKTTTLRMIAGFEPLNSGEIHLGGRQIDEVPAFERNMPMVFQSYALFPHLSIFENVAYGLRARKVENKVVKNDVDMALQLVNLEGLEGRYPGELSGGQQQRVALARALVLKPKIILFDEPLSNLDAKLRTQTRLEIKRVQKMLGITAIYVTHDQEEALSMSDQVIVMNKGEIVQAGPPEEIYNRPNSIFVADFIGDANFIDVDVLEVKDKIIAVNLQNQTLEINKGNSYQDIKAGEKVYLSIKPEAVNVNQNGAKFSGNLYSTSFLGANTEYEIEFENIIISSVQKNSESDLKTLTYGSKVSIDFNVDYLQILRKE